MAEKTRKYYIIENAQLMAEWDWIKNKELGLDPYQVARGSNKKAWWICQKSHTWNAVIATRSKGIGCPFCSNRRVWRGENDLLTTHPQLSQQWHPYKNGTLSPADVTAGSDKKVWWLGECGHEWLSRIANRTHGNGCPVCKNIKISKKISLFHISKSGSLESTHPDLCTEWHPTKNGDLLPSQLTAGSSKIIWWLGKCGHEWKASPFNRSRGTNCPYCSNQKVLSGYNDLETLFLNIALEWHPERNGNLTPATIVATSNKKVWWYGKCGHEWEQSVYSRTKEHHGCPICAKRLQTSFPEQALFYYIKKAFPDAINTYEEIFDNQMEIDVFIPSIKMGIEYDGANWHADNDSTRKEIEKYFICKERGISLIRVKEDAKASNNRTSDYIVNIRRHPTPQELDSSILAVLNILKVELTVDTQVDAPNIREGYISGMVKNSLLHLRPEVASLWHPRCNGKLTPDMFAVSSGTKVWWLCPECGNEWQARIAARTAGSGCKLCGYKKRAASRIKNSISLRGSLADNNPFLAKEWHPIKNINLSPHDVMSASGKKVWWKCSDCGFEWQATINSRARGCGCPSCTGHVKQKVENVEIAEVFASIQDK